MMDAPGSIAREIHAFLKSSTHVTDSSLTVETDLVAAEHLDSLVVMDLVCFLESRFGVRMEPHEVNPSNLRTVNCLARYVTTNLQRDAA